MRLDSPAELSHGTHSETPMGQIFLLRKFELKERRARDFGGSSLAPSVLRRGQRKVLTNTSWRPTLVVVVSGFQFRIPGFFDKERE